MDLRLIDHHSHTTLAVLSLRAIKPYGCRSINRDSENLALYNRVSCEELDCPYHATYRRAICNRHETRENGVARKRSARGPERTLGNTMVLRVVGELNFIANICSERVRAEY